MLKKSLVSSLLLFCSVGPALASTVVTINATDGLVLQGDWHRAEKPSGRAVLLLHMLHSSRHAWDALIPDLNNAGIDVLSVDQRGHGETGGFQHWPKAIEDAAQWTTWLRQQAGVKADLIAIAGASRGANVAMIACALDSQCATAIALSPEADFGGLLPNGTTTEIMLKAFADRSIYFAAAQADHGPTKAVKLYGTQMRGEIGLHLFEGTAHGTSLLHQDDNPPGLKNEELVAWLVRHQVRPK